jgi:DNA-binding MarR family transcriptional regulator
MDTKDRKPRQTQGESVFGSFLRTIGLLRRTMEPFFTSYGISGAQWGILAVLHWSERDGEGALRLTDLGERLIIRPPSVTTVIDRLEKMGLVERRASKADSRAKEVRLTAAGNTLVDRVLAAHKKQTEKVLANLSREEQVMLKELLEKVSGHLEAMGKESGTGVRE